MEVGDWDNVGHGRGSRVQALTEPELVQGPVLEWRRGGWVPALTGVRRVNAMAGKQDSIESIGAQRRGTTVERSVCECVCVCCVARVCKVCTLNGLCDMDGMCVCGLWHMECVHTQACVCALGCVCACVLVCVLWGGGNWDTPQGKS